MKDSYVSVTKKQIQFKIKQKYLGISLNIQNGQ
jgi:hypothetical protein